MNREKISETIEKINPKYLDEATEYKGKTRNTSKKAWYTWGAVAACLVLVFAVGFPLIKKRNDSGQKSPTDAVTLIEYENAYLEIIEDPTTIEKFGLQKKISADMIGRHIAFLQKEVPEAERSNYIVSDEVTNVELFEYAPAPYKAIKVFRDGNQYYYAWFDNYFIKQNESLSVQTAFEIFGIYTASDIAAITPTKTDALWTADGKVILDHTVISEFFNEICSLPSFSFDEYHDIVFAEELEALEGTNGGDVGTEAYTRVADDRKDMVLETKDGLRFAISYYPSYGWINISQTMSYYKMSAPMMDWFENNIK